MEDCPFEVATTPSVGSVVNPFTAFEVQDVSPMLVNDYGFTHDEWLTNYIPFFPEIEKVVPDSSTTYHIPTSQVDASHNHVDLDSASIPSSESHTLSVEHTAEIELVTVITRENRVIGTLVIVSRNMES